MYNNYFSAPTLINCIFLNNSAGVGGGMAGSNSSPTLKNCAFIGNSAGAAGGMYNENASSPTITNCVFSGNVSSNVGGMYNYNFSSPTITNCTFTGNAGGGYTIYNNYNCNTRMTNCILWGNDGGIANSSSNPNVTYTDSQDLSNPATEPDPNNNFGADPLFVRNPDLTASPVDFGDLHLQSGSPGSPCIGKGNNTVVTAQLFPTDSNNNPIDLDGNPRIADGTVDLGAYEYTTNTNHSPVADAGMDQTVEATGTLTAVTADGSGSSDPDGDALTYSWTEGTTPLGSTASLTVSLPLGKHTLTLTVTDPSGASDSDDVVITVQDTTAPTLTWGTATPAPNAAGWNHTAVDLSFTATDNSGGTPSASKSNPLHFTVEGYKQSQTVTVSDAAGNSAQFPSPLVNIDLTAPTTTGSATGTSTSTVTLSASDSLSGVKATYYTVDGGAQQTYSAPFTLPFGYHSITYWSVDNADNVETAKALPVDTRLAVTLSVASVSGKRGAKVSLSATVTQSSNGSKLISKTITFKVDGVSVGTAISDKKGGISLSYTIPSTLSVGSHTISATFAGDSTYKSGAGTGTLTVTR
jgi:hypothetical protein